QLLTEERFAEALELLDGRLPAKGPLRVQWLLERSLALLHLNRHAEAEDALRDLGQVPAALAPLLQWRQVLLARAAGDRGGANAIATTLENTLHAQGDAVLPEHRIMAHFGLARFWSDQGINDKAFANWTAGHAQIARFQPFSRETYRGFVDASIEAFGA